MIEVSCVCGKKLRAKPELAGRKVKCPACSQALVLPAPEPAANDLGQVDLAGLEEQAIADDPLGLGSDSSADPFAADSSATGDPLATGGPLGGNALDDLPETPVAMSGYDATGPAQDSATPPATERTGRKTWFYLAIFGGGVVAIAIVAGLVMMTMSFFVNPHERAYRELIELTEECADALESITDAGTTDAAAKRIKQVSKKYKILDRAAREFEDPTPELRDRLKSEYETKLHAAQNRVIAAWSSLGAKRQLADRLGNALGGTTGELPRSLRPSADRPLGLDTLGTTPEPVRIGR